ncbi:hypothetical protein B0H17DRAFT_938024 [Mycena rosella]|uniref:DUF6593 domain-containing protein n=1 Tax=Mycena rosella TaxID=1033263 RepID=A0AAD7DDI4_MYCRO|nr:hypothetical protein B0H17DRAFT_938024 [Mycena rosella]
MDSQPTLILAAPAHLLIFSADSRKNATILLGSAPAYIISKDPIDFCTELRAAGTGQALAQITWRDVLPDVITFPQINATEMHLRKWLQKAALPNGSLAHIMDTGYGQFILKTHPVHRLALFHEGDLQTPVAYWQSDATAPVALVIQARVCPDVQVHIIAAFIVREFKLRMRKKANQVVLINR